jgi:uncharacterized RDD family membrane protein YckC
VVSASTAGLLDDLLPTKSYMNELANFENAGDSTNEAPAPDPLTAASTETPALSWSDANPDSWRFEVAARLERYRTRRKPRSPRYPSLLLPFEAPESWSRSSIHEEPELQPLSTASIPAAQNITFVGRTGEPDTAASLPMHEPFQEPAKIIEFPRSAAIPVFHRSELADPVLDPDRPRIVEVPEILPPPPALGGILMEPAPPVPSARPDLLSVPSASIARRALAALVDSILVLASGALFAAIVFRLNPGLLANSAVALRPSLSVLRGPLLLLAASLAGITILIGALYQSLFVVYTGATPGLHAARLRLTAFDGSPLNRRLLRWRVLASFLSAFSAGLGYFWCLLDQNHLCWHDRISHTHVRAATAPEE